jgi:pyridoxine 4-dehydrogenase
VVHFCRKRHPLTLVSESRTGSAENQIAEAHHATPTQVALAWLLWQSPMMLPIPGTSSIEHLEQNVRAATLRLSEDECEKLSGVPELIGTR